MKILFWCKGKQGQVRDAMKVFAFATELVQKIDKAPSLATACSVKEAAIREIMLANGADGEVVGMVDKMLATRYPEYGADCSWRMQFVMHAYSVSKLGKKTGSFDVIGERAGALLGSGNITFDEFRQTLGFLGKAIGDNDCAIASNKSVYDSLLLAASKIENLGHGAARGHLRYDLGEVIEAVAKRFRLGIPKSMITTDGAVSARDYLVEFNRKFVR